MKVNKNTSLKSCKFIQVKYTAEWCPSISMQKARWPAGIPYITANESLNILNFISIGTKRQLYILLLGPSQTQQYKIKDNLWQRVCMPTWSATTRTFSKTSRFPVSARNRIITQLLQNLYRARRFFQPFHSRWNESCVWMEATRGAVLRIVQFFTNFLSSFKKNFVYGIRCVTAMCAPKMHENSS